MCESFDEEVLYAFVSGAGWLQGPKQPLQDGGQVHCQVVRYPAHTADAVEVDNVAVDSSDGADVLQMSCFQSLSRT